MPFKSAKSARKAQEDAEPSATPEEGDVRKPDAGGQSASVIDVDLRTEARVEEESAAPASAANAEPKSKTASKQDVVIARLKSPRGASISKLMEITGWQKHTLRGFLSSVVRKKLGLPLISDVGRDGQRRYRIAKAGEGDRP